MKDFDERRLLEGWPSVRHRNQWKSHIRFLLPRSSSSRASRLLCAAAAALPSLFGQPVEDVDRLKYFVCYSATNVLRNDALATIRSYGRERLTVLT